MLTLMLALALTQTAEPLEECVHSPETGEVRCAGEAFNQLVGKVLDARAERDINALKLTTCKTRLEVVEAALLAPKPVPVPAPASKVRPVVALMTAIVGTAALSTALLHEKMDIGSRVGLGAAGTVALGASFVIVF